MIRKMLLVTAAVMGMMAVSGGSVQAGHCHHGGGHGRGYSGYGGYRGGYGGGYGGYYGGPSYGYGGGIVVAPRYVPAPVYPVYPSYGVPYGGNPYGYGGYGGYVPYNQAFGVRSGNFSLFLGR